MLKSGSSIFWSNANGSYKHRNLDFGLRFMDFGLLLWIRVDSARVTNWTTQYNSLFKILKEKNQERYKYKAK